MNLEAQTKTRRRLALLFAVPLAFSLLFFLASNIGERTNDRIRSIQNLQSALLTLKSLTQDAESSERGFLLTGDDAYLVPYQQAKSRLSSQVDYLRILENEFPGRKAALEAAVTSATKVFDEAYATLASVQNQDFSKPLIRLQSNKGKDMDSLRHTAGFLQKALDQDLEAAINRQRYLARTTFLFFLGGLVVMVAVLFWLYKSLITYLYNSQAAHAELEQLNEELEHRIAERTLDLSQANEELQQFAYVASHDLQEPLRTITSFTQLLATRYQGRLDEDADEFIGYIVSSSRRMTDLINGLLALVRLRKVSLPQGPVSIEKLVRDAESSLQAAIRENNARIEYTPLPFLATDPMQITQLFLNLIGNGIKYRRAEDPVVKISARREPEEWIFSVEDNGQGFEPQYAERIFGLFQRLHGRDVQGTGMGLSIARKIIERHGGRMWAESRVGQGSTFFFTLPTSLEPGRFQTPSTSSRRHTFSDKVTG
jgi:signal transduction histidine kinase